MLAVALHSCKRAAIQPQEQHTANAHKDSFNVTLTPPSDVEAGMESQERPLTRRELREKWMREEAEAALLPSEVKIPTDEEPVLVQPVTEPVGLHLEGEHAPIVQPDFETLTEPVTTIASATAEAQPATLAAAMSTLATPTSFAEPAAESIEQSTSVDLNTPKKRSKLATVTAAAAVIGLTLTVALPAFDFTFDDPALATQGQIFAAGGTTQQFIDVESFESIDELEVAAEAATNYADTFTNDPTSLVQYPFSHGVPLTDGFGPRSWPVAGFHDAQDFAPNYGAAIRSIAAGTVLESGMANDGCGYGVKIKHRVDGQDVVSRYCHMVENSPTVKVGDKVKVGQFIGMVGSTGIATGPHLHLVIEVDGAAVDPMAFLAKYNKPKVVATNSKTTS